MRFARFSSAETSQSSRSMRSSARSSRNRFGNRSKWKSKEKMYASAGDIPALALFRPGIPEKKRRPVSGFSAGGGALSYDMPAYRQDMKEMVTGTLFRTPHSERAAINVPYSSQKGCSLETVPVR